MKFEFRILLFIMLGLVLSRCTSAPVRRGSQEPTNLVINLFGSDLEVAQERVKAGLEAVGPDGRLIIDFAPSETLATTDRATHGLSIPIDDVLAGTAKLDRDRIILSQYPESYPWIRDSSIGWQKDADGKFTDNVQSSGNQATTVHPGVFSAASIVTLLNSCEDSSLTLPRFRKIALQEGMIVSSDEGVCVTNSAVSHRVKDSSEQETLQDIGCKSVISSLDWQLWRKQGHPNGHIDMSVAFIGPHTAAIPSLDRDCRTKFDTGWPQLKSELSAAGIDTIEIPIGLGCIDKEPIVRTYSNMVILRDALLVARFLSPTPDLKEKYEYYNTQAVQILRKAMDEEKIPRRKIVQFPIGNEIKGGSVHCMTLNVPGHLSNCSEAHLESAIEAKISDGSELVKRKSELPNGEFCRRSSEFISIGKFLNKYIGDRALTGSTIQQPIHVSEKSRNKMEKVVAALVSARQVQCRTGDHHEL